MVKECERYGKLLSTSFMEMYYVNICIKYIILVKVLLLMVKKCEKCKKCGIKKVKG